MIKSARLLAVNIDIAVLQLKPIIIASFRKANDCVTMQQMLDATLALDTLFSLLRHTGVIYVDRSLHAWRNELHFCKQKFLFPRQITDAHEISAYLHLDAHTPNASDISSRYAHTIALKRRCCRHLLGPPIHFVKNATVVRLLALAFHAHTAAGARF